MQCPPCGKSDRPTVSPAGRDVPRRPDDDRCDAGPDGSGRGSCGALPRMARVVRRASTAVWSRRSIRSTPPASASLRRRAGRSSALAPVGHDGTRDWLAGIGDAFDVAAKQVAAAQNAFLPAIKAALAAPRSRAPSRLSGYEGSELLVARLLIESGADVAYVGTACPKTPWSAADAEWLADKGVKVRYPRVTGG